MFLDDSLHLMSLITFIVSSKVYIFTLDGSEALTCMFEIKNNKKKPIKTAVKHDYDFIDQ
jgi:hypothetical protein